jgi:hypothetical protein
MLVLAHTQEYVKAITKNDLAGSKNVNEFWR